LNVKQNASITSVIATFVVSSLTLLFLAACSEAPKQMSMPPASVEIAQVQQKNYREKTNYVGTLKSRKSITLSPNNIDGHITEIRVVAGQSLKEGDVLMRIDSRMQTSQTDVGEMAAASVQSDLATSKATLASLQSTLKSRLANVDYTKSQHDRYVVLCREGAVAQSDLDNWTNNHAAAVADKDAVAQQIEAQKGTVQKNERAYKQAIASLQVQKDILDYYEIKAPFSGIVGDIPVKVGDHVNNQSTLTTLTENHPLEVYTAIPSEKAVQVHLGMPVSLVATDGKQYGDSKVIFISPVVDSNSQTVLLKSLFTNAKSELRADQTVTSQIVWQEHPGITVPTSAVTQQAGKYFVFLAQPGPKEGMVAKQAEIEVYEIEGNNYQVKSGLKPGDKIVLTGIQRLGDGAPIVAKNNAADKTELSSGAGATH
jgi:RND family efflux transporter MFP subunit